MKKIIIIFMVTLSGCTSCNYSVELKGRVISNITGEPIIDAKVELKYKNIVVTTDSLGCFELIYRSGKSCKREFSITKSGYKDFEIEIDYKEPQKIYKVTNERYYYDLKEGKHLCPDTTLLSNIWLATLLFEKYSTDFSIKKDSLTVFLDVDMGQEVEFENYLKEHKNHKFKIIKQ